MKYKVELRMFLEYFIEDDRDKMYILLVLELVQEVTEDLSKIKILVYLYQHLVRCNPNNKSKASGDKHKE